MFCVAHSGTNVSSLLCFVFSWKSLFGATLQPHALLLRALRHMCWIKLPCIGTHLMSYLLLYTGRFVIATSWNQPVMLYVTCFRSSPLPHPQMPPPQMHSCPALMTHHPHHPHHPHRLFSELLRQLQASHPGLRSNQSLKMYICSRCPNHSRLRSQVQVSKHSIIQILQTGLVGGAGWKLP